MPSQNTSLSLLLGKFNLTLSTILFASILSQSIPYRPIPSPLINLIVKNQDDCLLQSYVTGYTKCLSPQMKKAHQQLGLLHLFTPSGIHFAALFLPLRPFLKMNFSWAKKMQLIILSLLIFVFRAPLPSPAGSRMAIIELLRIIFSRYISEPQLHKHLALLLGVFLDILFGGLEASAPSLALSYLFLSLINYGIQKKWCKLEMSLGFLFIQAAICSFWNKPFSLIGALTGQILSLIFPATFLLSIINSWVLETNYLHSFWIFLLNVGSQISQLTPNAYLYPETLICIGFIIHKRKPKWLILGLLVPI